MDTHMMVEIIGYIGSAFVLISFLMSSVVKLRVINVIGGTIFGIYALMIHSYPTAIMQVCLITINIYYLVQMRKDTRHFDLIDGKTDDAFLHYMLKYYRDDMKTYFPNIEHEAERADKAYIICCDATPAGLLLGKTQKDGQLEIIADYSTPLYRDCSVGKYLYSKLPSVGIHTLVFPAEAGKHEAYLKKMGFVKNENSYVKNM